MKREGIWISYPGDGLFHAVGRKSGRIGALAVVETWACPTPLRRRTRSGARRTVGSDSPIEESPTSRTGNSPKRLTPKTAWVRIWFGIFLSITKGHSGPRLKEACSRIKDGHVSTVSTRNGLPCNAIHWVTEDDAYSLWLSTACGLLRVDRSDLQAWISDAKHVIHPAMFDGSDGFRMHAMLTGYSPVVKKAPDAKLWFAHNDGVSFIDPQNLRLNKVPPPVHVEQITANGKVYAASNGLQLPPLVRDLTIDYTALSLAVPEKVHFRFRLEGQDKDWREVVNERRVQYSNLPPRHYRFRVMASNNSGVWNEEGASLDFSIAPAFYQTNWFRALCVAAFVALLWVAYLLRVRQLRSQERKLRDVVETIPTVAWTALPDGWVDFSNHHWEEYTGLSIEKGAGSGWETAVHPDDVKRHTEKWRASVASGAPFENEARYRRADGEYRWFLVRAVPLRDGGGKIRKWYGTKTDMEDRKRAEELQSDLAHINRVTTLGELAASIAHELKQPIAAAMTNAKTGLRWLKRDQPNMEEASEAMERIVKDNARAADIIDRLRSLYKKSPPQRESLDVNEIVREMVVLLRGEANRYAVSIRTDLAADLPENHGRPRAVAAGAHEHHAQRDRGDEGDGRSADREVAIGPGRPGADLN